MRSFAIPVLLLSSVACMPASDPVAVDPDGETTAAGPVEQPGATPAGMVNLHPIAWRDGEIELEVTGDTVYALLDGEPLPLVPGQIPARVARLGGGLEPIDAMYGGMFEVVGLSLGEGGKQGVLVTRQDFDRSGSRHTIYTLSDAGWKVQERKRLGKLSEFYLSLLTTPEGAVLGIREHELTESIEYDESDEATALWTKIEAELAAAPNGFAVVQGTPATVPTLPNEWVVQQAVATSHGWIVALAEKPLADGGYEPIRLLEWAPGETEPTVSPLPGVAELNVERDMFRLTAVGEHVLVAGLENVQQPSSSGVIHYAPYLAVGPGPTAARVDVTLADAKPHEVRISSVTRASDGELWIVAQIEQRKEQPSRPPELWRNGNGGWRPVELPDIDGLLASADATDRWILDPVQQEWFEAPAGPPKVAADPTATTVVWADETVWVVAEVGPAYPTSEDMYPASQRTVLFASRAVDAPASLPGYDMIDLERNDAAVRAHNPKPAGPYCRGFTVVLLEDAGDANATQRAEVIAKMAAAEEPRTLYLGATLDKPDQRQLVFDGHAESAKAANALVAEVSKLAGVPAKLDCRPRRLVEPIE